jgi:HK97 gp10 family phage protein
MSTRDETIVGGRQLDDLLQTLPAKMQKNINRSALRAGAATLLPEVKSRIPVDSGQLQASARITTRAKGATVSASVKVGNFVAWYAHLVEYGTQSHVERARDGAMQFSGVTVREVNHPGTRPQPFMRPAIDHAFPQVIAAVTAKIRQRLNQQGLNVPDTLPSDPQE